MAKIKLNSCPECCYTDDMAVCRYIDSGLWYVACQICRIQSAPFDTVEQAAADWNGRITSQTEIDTDDIKKWEAMS